MEAEFRVERGEGGEEGGAIFGLHDELPSVAARGSLVESGGGGGNEEVFRFQSVSCCSDFFNGGGFGFLGGIDAGEIRIGRKEGGAAFF